MSRVRVLADSNANGVRITTLLITTARFLLAEINTHRVLSRSWASSRAIPTERLIEQVQRDPFVPATFNKRVKGMGVGEPLDDGPASAARARWHEAAWHAAAAANTLVALDVDKSRVNRLLEPFAYVTGIVTATEWDNFLALRDHEDAQPEFRRLAQTMRSAMDASTPDELNPGDWHLPLLTEDEQLDLRACGNAYIGRMKLVSAGRCARVSFDMHEYLEAQRASIDRALRLVRSGHMSPFEHVARPFTPVEMSVVNERRFAEGARCESSGQQLDERFMESLEFSANFRKWVQFRREFPNEHRFDLLRQALAKEAA